jgi:hypothetical protein
MKRFLSFLLSIVFLHAQVSPVFAKRGGPDIGGETNVDTIGTFAGVLIPESSTTGSIQNTTGSANSIGLFSVGVPDAGMAQGAFVVFVEGTSYNGTITGIADPLDGKLVGILDAVSTFTVFNPLDPTGPGFAVFAQGNLEAQIRETQSFNNLGSLSTFSFATTRLEGLATIDIFGQLDVDNTPLVSDTVRFIVDGFKQSSTVVIVTDLTGTGAGN